MTKRSTHLINYFFQHGIIKKKSFTLNCSDKTGSFSAVCVNPTGSIKVVTVSDNLHLLRWPFTVPFKFIMKNVSLSLCSFSASYPLT